mmetsp:Transcript_17666/g.15480  ORF Transcript_17666/g.15480 Transcript_17666/m.15480 type:complete len:103 (-) Transcript_17666:451-759(-)
MAQQVSKLIQEKEEKEKKQEIKEVSLDQEEKKSNQKEKEKSSGGIFSNFFGSKKETASTQNSSLELDDLDGKLNSLTQSTSKKNQNEIDSEYLNGYYIPKNE